MSVEPVLVSISRSFTEEKNMADEKARVIDAGEDGWENLRNGVDSSWKDLKDSVDKAVSKFK